MSLFRYLPYWKRVREDLLNTLESLDGAAFRYSVHAGVPGIGDLVLELANTCGGTVAWLKESEADPKLPYSAEKIKKRDERIEALMDAFQQLDEFSNGITREELTRQRPHPDGGNEYFSYYEAYFELMRHEICTLGRIETHMMVLAAQEKRAPTFSSTTRVTRQVPLTTTQVLAVNAAMHEDEEPRQVGHNESAQEPDANEHKATAAIQRKLGDIDKVEATNLSLVPKRDPADEPAVIGEVEEEEDPLARFARDGTIDKDDDDLTKLMGKPGQ